MADNLPPDLALPPDFPADLRGAFGLPVEPRALPGPAPVTQRMIDALKEARETKGRSC